MLDYLYTNNLKYNSFMLWRVCREQDRIGKKISLFRGGLVCQLYGDRADYPGQLGYIPHFQYALCAESVASGPVLGDVYALFQPVSHCASADRAGQTLPQAFLAPNSGFFPAVCLY